VNENEYNRCVDELMLQIEESIDNSALEIDCENSNGILTLTVESNGSQMILSRQTASREVWLAARSGGFHFILKESIWRDTKTNDTLGMILQQAVKSQAGEFIDFNL
jgi:CyaY protein